MESVARAAYKPSKMSTISWVLYDLANTAYSMNIVSLYFGTWFIKELGQNEAYESLVYSLSMLLVAVTMPVFGDWSDCRNKKLPALMLFTGVCISSIFLIGVAGQHIASISILVPVVLILYVFANYTYQGSLVFYNALMPVVSTAKTIGRVSGYGVAIGYFGSIIGLVIARLFVEGEAFGLKIPGVTRGGSIAAFIPTAMLFLVFAIPIFIFVKESAWNSGPKKSWNLKQSYSKVFRTIRDTKKHPGLLRFLVAKLIFEDSVETVVVKMGVTIQIIMGFSSDKANLFFIILIPFAIIGSAICGILTDHYGPKKILMVVVSLWIVCLLLLAMIANNTLFWILGGILGALLGSTWTSARPLLITLAPRENLGEFFGLYALSGKLAAIIGPLIWSLVIILFKQHGLMFSYKAAIVSLAIIMVIGLLVLRGVPDFHQKLKKGSVL